jgi:hypothetical protein
MFADSALTAGLQMADIIAALMYASTYTHELAPKGAVKSLGLLDYTHIKPFWRLISENEFKSQKEYAGYRMFGFRVLQRHDYLKSAK